MGTALVSVLPRRTNPPVPSEFSRLAPNTPRISTALIGTIVASEPSHEAATLALRPLHAAGPVRRAYPARCGPQVPAALGGEMSYWVSLEIDGVSVSVSSYAEGGTQVIGGSTEADLNVTGNYGKYYSVRSLHERKAGDTVDELRTQVDALGTERDLDYWASTPGNVGYMASILLAWAEQYPEAIWRVS